MSSRAIHWQLFSHKPGSERAAMALDEALEKTKLAARARLADGTPVKEAVVTEAREHMLPTMERYAAMGAYDSEPLHVMGDELTKIATEMAGAPVEVSRWEV